MQSPATQPVNKVVMKHLLTCTCTLPVWKNSPTPIPTRFVAVSLVVDGVVSPHLAQCSNCGVVHQVQEIGRSQVLHGKSTSAGLLDLEEIKQNLPEKLTALLARNDVAPDVWQEVWLCWSHEIWGSWVILSKEETTPGVWTGKSMLLVGKGLWKVDTWSRDDNT